MKAKILIVLCLSGLLLNAQTTRTFRLVKEKPQIDSIVGITLKSMSKKNPYIVIRGAKDSIFHFNISSAFYRKGLYIWTLKGENIDFFKYKDFTIFVLGDKYLNQFFEKTKIYKSFKIAGRNNSKSPLKEVDLNDAFVYSFDYINGGFVGHFYHF